MAEPTAYEQYVLELVNRTRLDPLGEAARFGIDLNQGLEPGTIPASPLAPLAMNTLLIDAARGHGAWILSESTFSHTGADGSSPGERMASSGYAFWGDWRWGENIAMRAAALTQDTVELLHEQLFRSEGHRVNLLSAGFKEVGMALNEGDYDYGPPWGIWSSVTLAQNFARSGTASHLLGVAFDDADGDGFYDPGEGLGGLNVTIRDMATGEATALTTWSAGGWQTELGPGAYEVTFSGAGLAASVTLNAVMVGANLKLDLEPDAAPAGAASLTGTSRADTLSGTEAADRLSAASGNDLLFGGVGNDNLYGGGGGGGDTLIGGSGRDHLNGGDGDDVLIGGPGHDTLHGGTGADRFRFLSPGDRADRISDFNAEAGDRVEIGAILPDGAGTSFAELRAGGYARLSQGSGGANLALDADGGGDRWVTLVTFSNRTVAELGTDFLIA